MKNVAVTSASRLVVEEVGGCAEIARLTELSDAEQADAGYGDTLREILQQPRTWLVTGEQMLGERPALMAFLEGIRSLVLTGSGSSEHAGECVRLALQDELRVGAQTIGGGTLLTGGGREIAPARPGLMISLARSGDSPESVGALSLMLETEPDIKHLVVTCNRMGRLSEAYKDHPGVRVIALDDETNDRSLVMTSSFTNMVLATRLLGVLATPDACRDLTQALSAAADQILQRSVDAIAEVARRKYQRVLFLASGSRIGAAREAALKMMEMTAGRVTTMCETYLGLRHGPMSAVHADTLIVCFLSSEFPARGYECDLIRELQRKRLGLCKVIFGAYVPFDLAEADDLVVECAALAELGDENAPILDTIVGQLLAFFRCMEEGLTPDSPSESGVINRVVEEFTLHM